MVTQGDNMAEALVRVGSDALTVVYDGTIFHADTVTQIVTK